MKHDKKDNKTGVPHYTNKNLLESIKIEGALLRTRVLKKISQDDTSFSAKVNIGNNESAFINYTICTLYKWVFLHFGMKLSEFFKRVEEQMEKQKQINSNTI